jgi:hypothetical protein
VLSLRWHSGLGQPEDAPKWLNKVASRNDSFTRAHEDPFIMIKQEENKVLHNLLVVSTGTCLTASLNSPVQRREKVINNPIKMDKIKQKIEMELEEKDREKRLKKEAKKEKKEKKKAAKRQRKEGKR